MLKKSFVAVCAAVAFSANTAPIAQFVLTMPAEDDQPQRTGLFTVNQGSVTIQTEGKTNTFKCNDYVENYIGVALQTRIDDFKDAKDEAEQDKSLQKSFKETQKKFTGFMPPVLAAAKFTVTECSKTRGAMDAYNMQTIEEAQASYKALTAPVLRK